MREKDVRTAILLGEDGIECLRQASVAVVGLGGVGGYAAEAIARAGARRIVLVDFDLVQGSNINRQLIATTETIGISKAELFRGRISSIDPEIEIVACEVFADATNYAEVLSGVDYLIDAIDSLEAKIGLLEYAYHHGISAVSVFGAGNRLDPSYIRSADLAETAGCPLARRVRKALRERGIVTGIRAVFSIEQPLQAKYSLPLDESNRGKARPIGSISYMPGIMGLWAASELIRIILRDSPTTT